MVMPFWSTRTSAFSVLPTSTLVLVTSPPLKPPLLARESSQFRKVSERWPGCKPTAVDWMEGTWFGVTSGEGELGLSKVTSAPGVELLEVKVGSFEEEDIELVGRICHGAHSSTNRSKDKGRASAEISDAAAHRRVGALLEHRLQEPGFRVRPQRLFIHLRSENNVNTADILCQRSRKELQLP